MAGSKVWDSLGALSGAVAVALMIASVVLTDPYKEGNEPNPTQPSAAIARALVANRDDARAGSFFGLAAAFLLLWFFGYLHRHLRRAEGEDGWMSSVAYGGGLVTVGLLLVIISVNIAESHLASYGEDTQVAKTFFIYGWNVAEIFAPPLVALAAASAVVGFRFAALPRWLSWISVLLVAIMLGMFSTTPGLAAGVGLSWVALSSLALSALVWWSGRGRSPHSAHRASSNPAR
jgi:hypothetical protein